MNLTMVESSISILPQEPLSEENIYNKDLCTKANSVIAGNCILKCGGDSICESNCIRDFRLKNEDCPCEVFKKPVMFFFINFN